MWPRDIGLFVRSARTEARIRRLRPILGQAGALESVYAADPDPWASASPRYRYQSRKYEVLASLVPRGTYRLALDLGCGPGLLARHLAACADAVLGVDVSATAIANARVLHADEPKLRFEVHDVLDLPSSFDGRFDLVVAADVLYYLDPLDDAQLDDLVVRIAALLTPGGVCLVANHYFFRFDADSRRSRRIHDAFRASTVLTGHRSSWRPFYLVDTFIR